MTTITKLNCGRCECIQVTMKDEENEVRVHLHQTEGFAHPLIGLVVKSAKLGLLYEEGSVVAAECQVGN